MYYSHMNNLPDISGHDSPELERLCEQSAKEVRLIGSVSAATSLEMVAHMRNPETQLRALVGDHVPLPSDVTPLPYHVWNPSEGTDDEEVVLHGGPNNRVIARADDCTDEDRATMTFLAQAANDYGNRRRLEGDSHDYTKAT